MTSYISKTKLVSDILAYVKRQFGDESGVQISNDDIIRWVNAGQDEIFRRQEPIKTTANANLVAGQDTYTFPADILRIQAIYVDGVPVPMKSTQEAEDYILDVDPKKTNTGQPILWYSWGNQFTFYPKPEGDITNGIELRYIQTPTPVSAPTDTLSIPDAYYNRLIEYVLQQAYELDENFAAADTKAQQFTQNLDTYSDRSIEGQNVYPSITVLEEDAWGYY